jgi:cytochrome b561
MTTTSLDPKSAPTRWPDLGPAARPLWHCAALCLALTPITVLALLADARQLDAVDIWTKPLKFQVSGALHVVTLALLLPLIDRDIRERLVTRLLCWAVALCTLGEVLYITLQAGRGRHSHFNLETPLEAMLYSVMGVGAVIMILGAGIIGALIARRPRDGIGPGLKWGAALGLGVGFVATLITAGYLGGNGGHWVGVPATPDGGGIPIFGWSTEVGDLRVAHFFALHMMQVLPLLGWLADRAAPSLAPPIVGAGTATGIAITTATFLQALAGDPFPG